MVTQRVRISNPDQIDEEGIAWLVRACQAVYDNALAQAGSQAGD